VKEYLKPYVYKQREHNTECDLVLFVERAGELRCAARLSYEVAEPKRKRVWNERKRVARSRPETRWPIHVQVEAVVKYCGGPNPRLLKKAGMTCG